MKNTWFGIVTIFTLFLLNVNIHGAEPKCVIDGINAMGPNINKARVEYSKKIKMENDKLIISIKKALEIATKSGNFDEAMAIKTALDKAVNGGYINEILNPPAQDLLGKPSWNFIESSIALPLGGKVIITNGTYSLVGPGNGDMRNAVAIFPNTLNIGESISGIIITNRKWCGFALGANKTGSEFSSVYNDAHGETKVFRHKGTTRQLSESLPGKLDIMINGPANYTLLRKSKTEWILKVGDSEFPFQDTNGNDYFGITSYDGGKVDITFNAMR